MAKERLGKNIIKEAVKEDNYTDYIVVLKKQYESPGRASRMTFVPDILGKIVTLSNVKAIKEASGDFSQISKMMAAYKDKIDFYSGNDDSIVPFMSIGGKGVISVLSNIVPDKVHEMTAAALNGDYKKAQSLQLEYLKLANDLFIETSPIPVKTALNLMGKQVGPLRLPLYEMDSKNEEILKNTLKDYNLI